MRLAFLATSTHDNRADRHVNHDHGGQESIPLTERVDTDPDEDVEAAPNDKKKRASGRKEKSVLQTKLSKLAIQIGYAGM